MSLAWLGAPVRRARRGLRRERPGSLPLRRRFRPRLEQLESRTLLSGPGILNPKFGTGGLVTTSFGRNEFATTVLTEPDGKIVVVGTDYAR